MDNNILPAERQKLEIYLNFGVSMGNISQNLKDKFINILSRQNKELVFIKLLNKRNVAEIFDCSTRQVCRFVSQGKLHPEILSNQLVRFHLNQVLEFGNFKEQIIDDYRIFM